MPLNTRLITLVSMNMTEEVQQNYVSVLCDIFNLDPVKIISSESDLCEFYKDCEKNKKLKAIVFLDKIRQRRKCLNFFLKSKSRYKGLILTSLTKEAIEDQMTKKTKRKAQFKLKSFIGVKTASSVLKNPGKMHSECIEGNIRKHFPTFRHKMNTDEFRMFYEMEDLKRERIIGILNAMMRNFLPVSKTKRNLKSSRKDTRKRNFFIGCYRVPYGGEVGLNADDLQSLDEHMEIMKKKEYFYIQETEVEKVLNVMKDVKIVKGFVDVKKDENSLKPTFSACMAIFNYYKGSSFSCWEEVVTKCRKENQKIVVATEKSCLKEVLKSLNQKKIKEFYFDEFDASTLERFKLYIQEALENDEEIQTLIEEKGKNEYNLKFEMYNKLKYEKVKEQRNKYKRSKEGNLEHRREMKKRIDNKIESLDIQYLHNSKAADPETTEIYDLLNGKRKYEVFKSFEERNEGKQKKIKLDKKEEGTQYRQMKTEEAFNEEDFFYGANNAITQERKKKKDKTTKEVTKKKVTKPRTWKTYKEQKEEHDKKMIEAYRKKVEVTHLKDERPVNIAMQDSGSSSKTTIMSQEERKKKYENIAARERRLSMGVKPKEIHVTQITAEETERNNKLPTKKIELPLLKRKMSTISLYPSNTDIIVCEQYDLDGCDICKRNLKEHEEQKTIRLLGEAKSRKKRISCYDKHIKQRSFEEFKKRMTKHFKELKEIKNYKNLQFKEKPNEKDLIQKRIIDETRSVIYERDKETQNCMITEIVKEKILSEEQLKRTKDLVTILSQEKMKTIIYPRHKKRTIEARFKNGKVESFREGYMSEKYNVNEFNIIQTLRECLYSKPKLLTSEEVIEQEELNDERLNVYKWLNDNESTADSGLSSGFSGLLFSSSCVLDAEPGQQIHHEPELGCLGGGHLETGLHIPPAPTCHRFGPESSSAQNSIIAMGSQGLYIQLIMSNND